MNPIDKKINLQIAILNKEAVNKTLHSKAARDAICEIAKLFETFSNSINSSSLAKLTIAFDPYKDQIVLKTNDMFQKKMKSEEAKFPIVVKDLQKKVFLKSIVEKTSTLEKELSEVELDELVKEQILVSKQAREEKILRFDEHTQALFNQFSEDCLALGGVFTEYQKAQVEAVRDDATEQSKEEFERASIVFQETIASMENRYKEIHFTQSDFDDLYRNNLLYSDFIFSRELVLNHLSNTLQFEKEIKKNIEDNKKTILGKFFSHVDFTDRYDQITCSFQLESSETHHGGKVATKVSFYNGGARLGEVYYKPRSALIDEKVIKLFEDINKKNEDHSLDLPVYKIQTFPSEFGAFSIWDEVKGETCTKKRNFGPGKINLTPSEAIEMSQDVEINERKDEFIRKLKRMDAVLGLIGMSDLHGENLILNKYMGIVPIDLENIQYRPKEGVFIYHDMGWDYKEFFTEESNRLNENQKKSILDFNPTVKRVPFRFLVLSTQALRPLLASRSAYLGIAEAISQAPHLKVTIGLDELKKCLITDTLNSDIPYFTEFNDKIYYGNPLDGIVIGTRE